MWYSSIVYNDLAAAYALEGKIDEAKSALAEARRLNPKLTVKWLQSVAPNIPALFDGLRKAGATGSNPVGRANYLNDLGWMGVLAKIILGNA